MLQSTDQEIVANWGREPTEVMYILSWLPTSVQLSNNVADLLAMPAENLLLLLLLLWLSGRNREELLLLLPALVPPPWTVEVDGCRIDNRFYQPGPCTCCCLLLLLLVMLYWIHIMAACASSTAAKCR